jgi:Rad3-related DNA helicase
MQYQTLFQEQTREVMNIKLENTYIVIDEAHSLVDALNAMNSICLEKEDFQTIIRRRK